MLQPGEAVNGSSAAVNGSAAAAAAGETERVCSIGSSFDPGFEVQEGEEEETLKEGTEVFSLEGGK